MNKKLQPQKLEESNGIFTGGFIILGTNSMGKVIGGDPPPGQNHFMCTNDFDCTQGNNQMCTNTDICVSE